MTSHPFGAARLTLRDGLTESGLSHSDVWVRYIGLGGSASIAELAREIAQDDDAGSMLDDHEHNLIAHALNEHFADRDQDHPVVYRDIPPEG